jgi:hypothetical protein
MSSEEQVNYLIESISELKEIDNEEFTLFVKQSIIASYPQKPTG